jgi:FkbM family methyltransferase
MRYLDIGANHPINISNTFLFYTIGASGVLVEPDPDLCGNLSRTRPRDTVLNVGCAFDNRRRATLNRLTARVFNTFSDQQAEFDIASSNNWGPDERQEIVSKIDIDMVPANDILETHFKSWIDFLSIDAEGVDIPILASIDLERFRPKMICIEGLADDFCSILVDYEFVARTPDNSIFRRIRNYE